MMSAEHNSCLLLATPECETRPFVRALHGAGFSVLEQHRPSSESFAATAGDFDFIAVTERLLAVLPLVSGIGTRVIALLPSANPAYVAGCLRGGADACLQLDSSPDLIVAQVQAVLRRAAPSQPMAAKRTGLLVVGDLVLDLARFEVRLHGRSLSTTPTEFYILKCMAEHAGETLSSQFILNTVSPDYHYTAREAPEVFKVYIRRIRRKFSEIEDGAEHLVTVRGFGYRLEAPTKERPREAAGA